MNILIPMAGAGSRFSTEGYTIPKPLIKINGEEMISKAVRTLGFGGEYIFIIRKSEESTKIKKTLSSLRESIDCVNSVKIIEIEKLTEGPAATALIAETLINTNDPLVIANCDQIMWWDGREVQRQLENSSYDGVLVTYYSTTTKNSYVMINKEGEATKVREKEVISDISTNGIHFWKKGADFVSSAKQSIKNEDRSINGEFYIAPTYNILIKSNKKIGIHHIPTFQHHAVGTPDDLREYIRNENS